MKREKDPITARISQVFIGISVGIGVTLIVISLGLQIPIKDGWDVANWATLVVEIGIGIAIASAILLYEGGKREKSQEQQNKIAELIEQTKKITSELERKTKKDEKYHIEQRDFAIHRARSYLSSLYDTITILTNVGVEPDVPPEYQIEFHTAYEQKNEIVRQLEYLVNQSDSVLEQSFLQRITDVIELARVNPKITDENFGFALDTSHCTGIKNQIEELLKIMPNPPV